MAEIVFVGTSDAFGSGGRRNSAILVRDRGHCVLLDCGPTTAAGLQTLGIDAREIDTIALSHFHGDHCAGVPFLLIDFLYERRRETPLRIVGPPGVQDRIEAMARLFEFNPDEGRAYDLRYDELEVERDLPLDGFTLTPLPAYHHPATRPHMLRVRTQDREVLFTGDTGWHEKLPEYVGEPDLFISECVFFEGGFEYHLNHERLQRERGRFQARRTILTHLGSEVLDNRDRVEFETADDGLILEL
jgi:ribonuclease BN (tRNA processing enzyme)